MLKWDEFHKVSEEEWKSKIDLDLKGKKNAADFAYDVEGDYFVDPFITSVAQQELFTNFAPSKSCIKIQSLDTSIANVQAKKYLNYGVSALIFTIDEATDYSVLFNEIYVELIDVFLLVAGNQSIAIANWDKYLQDNPSAHSIILLNNQVNKLSADLTFKNRLTSFTSFLSKHKNGQKAIIMLEMKNDFLAQVAELRAMRSIWQNNDLKSEDLLIISTLAEEAIGQSEVNPLIVANYMMMSAYFGMANFVCGFSDQDEELARLSVNIHHIFREENLITQVQDPTNGSYIIEALTTQMAIN